MKKFTQFIAEAIQSSDVHSDLAKTGRHIDQKGGYHLYQPHKKMKPADVVKILHKHGFTRNTHYNSGGKMPDEMYSFSRTPAPYHEENISIDHKDGHVTWIHRSVQR